MCSINRAISIPVIVALIFSVAAWCKNFAGVYVRDNSKRDYIELRSDGTFFLREHGLGLARKNESAARSTIRRLNVSEMVYQTTYPSQGYAASLTVLGPGAPPIDCENAANVNADHSCLVDGVLGCATAWCVKGGYRYAIVSSFKASPLADYTVTATPVDTNTGSKNFCANADRVIRERIGPPLSNPITHTECGTWSPLSNGRG